MTSSSTLTMSLALWACLPSLAAAQAASATPAAPAASGAAVLSPPLSGVLGTGPGYHDPRSPFKPLQERDGVVSWSVLSSVTTKPERNRLVPVFPKPVQALNNQTVKVQGFMMPLEPGDKQKHFLLSSVPTSCTFCVPAGPEGLVEVKTLTPVKYTLEPVTVEGKLAVLPKDPYGLYYRMLGAQPVSAP
jgi:hypothetical protein